MTLAPLDWAIIVVYLVGCMVAGIWMRRYISHVDDFTVAGREVDVNLGIASLAATEMGLVTIMYTAQLGFEKGFAGATIGVIWAICLYLVGATGFVIGPLRAAGVVTIPELFEKRFGVKVRILAGFFVAVGGILNMGIYLRLGGEFLVHVTGMPVASLQWVMTALLGLVLVYTVLGGMLSVLVTDFLQFIVMGLGIVITSILVVMQVGWTDLVNGLWNHWLAAPASVVADATVKAAHPFNPFHATSFGSGYLLWQMILILSAVTTWQTMVTRVLASKNEATAKKMYRRTAFYFVGRFALPGLWGAAALIYFTNHGGLPADLTSLTAMPAYLKTLLPVGLIGIVIAAMLAAEMSTDSGYMLTWATVIYNDLILPCVKRPLSEMNRLLITRTLVLLIGVFLLFFGLWYEIPGNAWDYLGVTANIYLASLFTLLVAGLYWPRANSWGGIAAIILGAIGPVTFLVVNAFVAKENQIAPQVAGFSSIALAFLGMVVGSWLGPRPKPSASEI
ncbi:MAG: sodium:solute symporter family protein [Verrucomicrobia bacterium]|nr:sodium:solute symporter family protein [Verrucomicrobiota bacterium]